MDDNVDDGNDEVQNQEDLIFSRDEDDIGIDIIGENVVFGNTDDEDNEEFSRYIEEDENNGENENDGGNENEDVFNEPFREFSMEKGNVSKDREHLFHLGSNNGLKLRMIISELQVMIDESRLELDDLKMEYRSTKQELLQEQSQRLHLEEKVEQLNELEEYKNTNRLEDLRGEKLHRKMEEFELLKQRNHDIIKEKTALEKKYLKILKHKEFTQKSCEGEIQRLTEQATTANTLLEERMRNIGELKKRISELKSNHEEALKEKIRKMEEKNKEIIQIQNSSRSVELENERYRRIEETNKKLINDMNILKNEKLNLQKDLHTKQRHISDLENRMNEIQDSNTSSISSNKYFYETEITKLKDELIREKTEKEKYKHSLLKYENNKNQHNKHILEQRNHEIKSLQLEVRQLQRKNHELEMSKVDEMNTTIHRLQKEHKEHIQNICKKLLVEKKEIRQEIHRTKTQLDKEKKKAEKACDQLNHSKSIIKSLEETVKLEESKSSNILRDLNHEKEKSINIESRFLNQSQTKHEELQSTVYSLKNRNEKLKRELEGVRNKSKEFHSKHVFNLKGIVEKYNKQKEWIRRSRQREEDQNSKIQFLEIEFNRLNKTVVLKEKQINHLQKMLKMLKIGEVMSKSK